MNARRLLTLNAGSSSLKFAIYDVGPLLTLKLSGQVSGLDSTPRFSARAGGEMVANEPWPRVQGLSAALQQTFNWLDSAGWANEIGAVGHRIVHGGLEFSAPTRLSDDVLKRLKALSPLAPLHQPHNLRGVERAAAHFPGTVQVGVFDTAFHATQPQVARLYALPRDLIDAGVIAYGFHGLSYEYIAGALRSEVGAAAGGRSIVLHMGSGVSLCAMESGRSVATTMGFSALDGPPMSTRSGALDPGVILHLMQARGMSADSISDLLYHQSGLLGLSGISGDMQTLLASRRPHARQALEVYVYRIAREIGSLTAALGGLDTLVFTAGVGENASRIRARIAEQCAWLGVRLDPKANQSGLRQISREDSQVRVLVIPTDEQIVIARGVVGFMDDLSAQRRATPGS